MSVTHIAGPVIEIGQRKIQRCAVCGEKLGDNLPFLQGRVGVVSTDPNRRYEMLEWEPGGLVRHDGNHWAVVEHDNGANLPRDACIDLIEE